MIKIMTPNEAEKLVREYGGIIGKFDTPRLGILSELPCSKAKIKHAFYVFVEDLIRNNKMESELRLNIIKVYSMLNRFIPDIEAAPLNEIAVLASYGDVEKMNKLNQDLVQKYKMAFARGLHDEELEIEITSYILECEQNQQS